MFNVLRNCQIVFHSKCTILHFYRPMCQGFDFSISSLTFVIIYLFDHRDPSVCEVVSHCGFDLHFPNA